MTFGRWLGALAVVPVTLLSGAAHAEGSFEAQMIAEAKTRVYEPLCGKAAPGFQRCFSQRLVSNAHGKIVPDAASPIPGSLQAADLVSAYNIPAAAKSGGAVIAIVDAYGAPQAFTDLTAYRSQYAIPALPKCAAGTLPVAGGTPCFAAVGQTGGATPPVGTGSNAGWQSEVALDLDMVSAGCPDCSILLVEATDASNNLYTAVSEAVTLGATYVTNSWGGPEIDPTSGTSTVDTTLDGTTFNHAGVSIFSASGDQDYNDQDAPLSAASPNYPASSPYSFSVGGTTLSQGGGGARGWSEVVWSNANFGTQAGTGSGCSQVFTKPAFQSAIAMGSCTKRGSADLSAAADASSGISVYATGSWTAVGGTSAATPLVTAIFARLKIKGATPAYPYTHESAFYDVTSGSNDPAGTCTDVNCKAGVGWDGPTGVGTPNATELASGGGTGVDGGGGGTDSGADGGDSGSGTDSGNPGGNDSGTPVTGNDSGTPVTGNDSGTPGGGDDGGATTGPATVADAGDGLAPAGPSKAGCACTTLGTSAPLEEGGGLAALALGAIALLGSRRRKH